jgi:hypothetical protein
MQSMVCQYIKKGYQHLLGRQESQRRFEVIQEMTEPSTPSVPTFEVREMCQVLGVSRSGYYAHQHKAERLRRREDRILTSEIHNTFEQSEKTYGSPRLVRALRKLGLQTSKTRVR